MACGCGLKLVGGARKGKATRKARKGRKATRKGNKKH